MANKTVYLGMIGEQYYNIIKELNNRQNKYVTQFITRKSEEAMCLEKDMFPVIRVPFEDTEICIQKNYDEVLKRVFGNYMTLPPVEDRVSHGAKILDFGDGKGNMIK